MGQQESSKMEEEKVEETKQEEGLCYQRFSFRKSSGHKRSNEPDNEPEIEESLAGPMREEIKQVDINHNDERKINERTKSYI